MRFALCLLPLPLVLAGCSLVVPGNGPMTPKLRESVTNDVRGFMQTVAQDVTKDGPSAWHQHFADTPSFFMAVNGQMAFSDSQSATQGIQGVAQMFPHIELHWADDIRVDPLSREFAVVATPYHEILTTADNHQINSSGFFTALVEARHDQWQFRDVHWSVPAPMPVPDTTPSATH